MLTASRDAITKSNGISLCSGREEMPYGGPYIIGWTDAAAGGQRGKQEYGGGNHRNPSEDARELRRRIRLLVHGVSDGCAGRCIELSALPVRLVRRSP